MASFTVKDNALKYKIFRSNSHIKCNRIEEFDAVPNKKIEQIVPFL